MLSPILEKLTDDSTIKSGSGLSLDLATVDTESEAGFELGRKYEVRTHDHHLRFVLTGPVTFRYEQCRLWWRSRMARKSIGLSVL